MTTETTVVDKNTYKVTKFNIGKTVWTVMVVSGKNNYVNVSKPTPWHSLGTDFANMDLAISHYKNPNMKVQLLKIEMGIS